MEVKNQVQAAVYKDLMELQKQLVNQVLQIAPNQNMQTNNTEATNAKEEIKPPENPNGTISKYA